MDENKKNENKKNGREQKRRSRIKKKKIENRKNEWNQKKKTTKNINEFEIKKINLNILSIRIRTNNFIEQYFDCIFSVLFEYVYVIHRRWWQLGRMVILHCSLFCGMQNKRIFQFWRGGPPSLSRFSHDLLGRECRKFFF